MMTVDKIVEQNIKPLLQEIDKLPKKAGCSKMFIDHSDAAIFPFTTIPNIIDIFSCPVKELHRFSLTSNLINNETFVASTGIITDRLRSAVVFSTNHLVLRHAGAERIRSIIEDKNLPRPTFILSSRGLFYLIFRIQPHNNKSVWEDDQIILHDQYKEHFTPHYEAKFDPILFIPLAYTEKDLNNIEKRVFASLC